MKYLILLLIIFISSCSCISTEEILTQEQKLENVKSDQQRYLPIGSEIIEVVLSNYYSTGWIIFKFRNECFLSRDCVWCNSYAFSNIKCPTTELE